MDLCNLCSIYTTCKNSKMLNSIMGFLLKLELNLHQTICESYVKLNESTLIKHFGPCLPQKCSMLPVIRKINLRSHQFSIKNLSLSRWIKGNYMLHTASCFGCRYQTIIAQIVSHYQFYGGGLVAKSCPTPCDSIDSSPHLLSRGISQTRILEWEYWSAISFSRGSSSARD